VGWPSDKGKESEPSGQCAVRVKNTVTFLHSAAREFMTVLLANSVAQFSLVRASCPCKLRPPVHWPRAARTLMPRRPQRARTAHNGPLARRPNRSGGHKWPPTSRDTTFCASSWGRRGLGLGAAAAFGVAAGKKGSAGWGGAKEAAALGKQWAGGGQAQWAGGRKWGWWQFEWLQCGCVEEPPASTSRRPGQRANRRRGEEGGTNMHLRTVAHRRPTRAGP